MLKLSLQNKVPFYMRMIKISFFKAKYFHKLLTSCEIYTKKRKLNTSKAPSRKAMLIFYEHSLVFCFVPTRDLKSRFAFSFIQNTSLDGKMHHVLVL